MILWRVSGPEHGLRACVSIYLQACILFIMIEGTSSLIAPHSTNPSPNTRTHANIRVIFFYYILLSCVCVSPPDLSWFILCLLLFFEFAIALPYTWPQKLPLFGVGKTRLTVPSCLMKSVRTSRWREKESSALTLHFRRLTAYMWICFPISLPPLPLSFSLPFFLSYNPSLFFTYLRAEKKALEHHLCSSIAWRFTDCTITAWARATSLEWRKDQSKIMHAHYHVWLKNHALKRGEKWVGGYESEVSVRERKKGKAGWMGRAERGEKWA